MKTNEDLPISKLLKVVIEKNFWPLCSNRMAVLCHHSCRGAVGHIVSVHGRMDFCGRSEMLPGIGLSGCNHGHGFLIVLLSPLTVMCTY